MEAVGFIAFVLTMGAVFAIVHWGIRDPQSSEVSAAPPEYVAQQEEDHEEAPSLEEQTDLASGS